MPVRAASTSAEAPVNRSPSPTRSLTRSRRTPAPIQYFNSTCVCSERFGGVDCGECSYGYNDGGNCEHKTVRPRKSLAELTDDEWRKYVAVLLQAQASPSRYMVVTVNFTTDYQSLLDSMTRLSVYHTFVWVHYTAPNTPGSLPPPPLSLLSSPSTLSSSSSSFFPFSLEMNRDSQMWPSFAATTKTPTDCRQSPGNTAHTSTTSTLPYEEEMSGMVTLKRKKDQGGGMEGDLSRSSSVSSHSQRSSSSSGGGHRRRSQSNEPGMANRTSRGNSHNHY